MHTAILIAALFAAADVGEPSFEQPSVVVVVGSPGMDEYGEKFEEWAARWEEAADRAGARRLRVGNDPSGETNDRERLERLIADEPKESTEALWVIFIGHGTFDGQSAKFNLRGPDVTATRLGEWLEPFKRPLVLIHCGSSSAPFINRLSHPQRIVVTATKSGFEQNYARFGEHLSAAIVDPAADLDKDDQTSLLEAFIFASARVAEFYEQAARLSTETALVDDNGDKLGTPAAWFRGIRATRRAKDGAKLDGLRAHQLHLIRSPQEQNMAPEVRTQRNELERQIEALRATKTEATDLDEHYDRLETLMVALARLYASLDEPEAVAR